MPSTAATWPWGSERTISKASSRPTRGSFFRRRRKVSTFSMGQEERLAIVRFLTLPSSRHPSRSRTAGGEDRLGTISIYMATNIDDTARYVNNNPHHYMGTHTHRNHGTLPAKSAGLTCFPRSSQAELRAAMD